jgi:hypothetical protein
MSSSKEMAKEMAGVVGFFDHAGDLLKATEQARLANWESFDAYSPFPIHGLEHAQGLKRSWIPYATFCAGLTGTCCAFLLEYWTSAVSWPINVGGKPLNSWPAFVPVMFELTVLFAGLTTAGAMFFANRLPNTSKKAFDSKIPRDRFALMIESPRKSRAKAGQKVFNEAQAAEFLKSQGAKEVRTVYEEGWFA